MKQHNSLKRFPLFKTKQNQKKFKKYEINIIKNNFKSGTCKKKEEGEQKDRRKKKEKKN